MSLLTIPHSSRRKGVKSESPFPSDSAEAREDEDDHDEDYECRRERRIRDNQALLEALGLVSHRAPAVPPSQEIKSEVLKRKRSPVVIRRNSRRQSRSESVVYNGKHLKHRTSTGEFLANRPERTTPPPHIIYGHIPGIPVLYTWTHRNHIGSAVHNGGLRVRKTSCRPAASLCIYSQGTEITTWQESLDFGPRFTFVSGYGNYTFADRDRSGQVRDQTFDHEIHQSLLQNVEEGIEVRVIRGSKTTSSWAPESGFRYDGLYKVISARTVTSPITGKRVCTFEFRRSQGQPVIPRRSIIDHRGATGQPGNVERITSNSRRASGLPGGSTRSSGSGPYGWGEADKSDSEVEAARSEAMDEDEDDFEIEPIKPRVSEVIETDSHSEIEVKHPLDREQDELSMEHVKTEEVGGLELDDRHAAEIRSGVKLDRLESSIDHAGNVRVKLEDLDSQLTQSGNLKVEDDELNSEPDQPSDMNVKPILSNPELDQPNQIPDHAYSRPQRLNRPEHVFVNPDPQTHNLLSDLPSSKDLQSQNPFGTLFDVEKHDSKRTMAKSRRGRGHGLGA